MTSMFTMCQVAAGVSSGWPNASTTGYGSTSLTASALTTLTPGNTYNGLQFPAGGVSVGSGSGDITVSNSLFTALAATGAMLQISSGFTGKLIVDHCEFVGAGSSGVLGNYGILNQSPCSLEVRYCNMHELGQPINLNGATGTNYIHDCYIWHLLGGSGTHYECLYYGGGGGAGFSLDMEHNTLINENGQTACIFIQTEFGDASNITINNNYCYIEGGGDDCISLDGTGYSNNFSNIAVTNNALRINAGSQFFYTLNGLPSTTNPGTVTGCTQSGNYSVNSGYAIYSPSVTYPLNQIVEGADGWLYKSLQAGNLNNTPPNSGGSTAWWSSSGLAGFVG